MCACVYVRVSVSVRLCECVASVLSIYCVSLCADSFYWLSLSADFASADSVYLTDSLCSALVRACVCSCTCDVPITKTATTY